MKKPMHDFQHGDMVEIRGQIKSINSTPEFRQLEIELAPGQTVWVKESQAEPSTTKEEVDALKEEIATLQEMLALPPIKVS